MKRQFNHERFKELMAERDWTPFDLMMAARRRQRYITENTVKNVLAGETIPFKSTVVAIARALGVDESEFEVTQ